MPDDRKRTGRQQEHDARFVVERIGTEDGPDIDTWPKRQENKAEGYRKGNKRRQKEPPSEIVIGTTKSGLRPGLLRKELNERARAAHRCSSAALLLGPRASAASFFSALCIVMRMALSLAFNRAAVSLIEAPSMATASITWRCPAGNAAKARSMSRATNSLLSGLCCSTIAIQSSNARSTLRRRSRERCLTSS